MSHFFQWKTISSLCLCFFQTPSTSKNMPVSVLGSLAWKSVPDLMNYCVSVWMEFDLTSHSCRFSEAISCILFLETSPLLVQLHVLFDREYGTFSLLHLKKNKRKTVSFLDGEGVRAISNTEQKRTQSQMDWVGAVGDCSGKARSCSFHNQLLGLFLRYLFKWPLARQEHVEDIT